jgi:hypothetical protein
MFIYHRWRVWSQTKLESKNEWLAFDQIPSCLVWSFAKRYMVFEFYCSMFYHPDSMIMKSRRVGKDVFFLADKLRYGDPRLDESVFEGFRPWDCLWYKHRDLNSEANQRLRNDQDPLMDHEIFKFDSPDRWEDILTGQGYYYYLYLEGLVRNDGDLERYVLNMARVRRLVTSRKLSRKRRVLKLDEMAKIQQ